MLQECLEELLTPRGLCQGTLHPTPPSRDRTRSRPRPFVYSCSFLATQWENPGPLCPLQNSVDVANHVDTCLIVCNALGSKERAPGVPAKCDPVAPWDDTQQA